MQSLARAVGKPAAYSANQIRQCGSSLRAARAARNPALPASSRWYSDQPSSSDPSSSEAPRSTPIRAEDSFDQKREKGSFDRYEDFENLQFPDLMQPDYLMDSAKVVDFPPTRKKKGRRQMKYGAKVTIRNSPSMFLAEQQAIDQIYAKDAKDKAKASPATLDAAALDEMEGDEEDIAEQMNAMERAEQEEVDREEDDQKDKDVRQKLREALFTSEQQKALHEYIVLFRRVVQQTEKGRRPRFSVLAVVGNGNGLVGYGEGKHEEGEEAKVMAFKEAYRNMDYVPRFEKRTLFTPLRTKLGSTEIILRPRPVGFGLAVNPNIHKILTAAGIKDCGGKVWGSRTPLNVIKGTFRMLLSGNAPLSMGNGIGGPGRKLDKGSGVISKGDVERARGRKLVDLKTF